MLMLHRAGHITLPEVKRVLANPMVNRKKPEKLTNMDEAPIQCSLKEMGPLTIQVIERSTRDEVLFNRLIETYHYLGFTHPIGETMKFIIYAGDRPVACMSWCSPARKLAQREQHIGWDDETRENNLSLVAYNTRYLILPWVHVPHLASHLLGKFSRNISKYWNDRYGHPLYYLETFVQPDRYPGTCYRAANWISLGLTTGRGKYSTSKKAKVTRKELLVYPLHKRFREKLSY
jgi:hypothetical protein